MKTAIAGYGNIGKKHLKALEEVPGIEVEAISDEQLQTVPGNILFYTSVKEMLESHEDIDLLSVCTPNHLHEEHAIMALEKGCHVICEKPLSLSSESGQKMIAAAKANDRHIFCVMQNRFSPVSTWLKALVDQDALGKIFLINVACYWNRNMQYYRSSGWRGSSIKDGGTLFTQFSHYVDTLYWLFGELHIQNAVFDNFNHQEVVDFEDSGTFNFRTAEGAMGNFMYTSSVYESNFESTMTIIGEKGTVKIAGQYMNEVEYCNIQNVLSPQINQGNNIQNLSEVYKNAIATLDNSDRPMTTAQDGMNVVRIIENVYKFKV